MTASQWVTRANFTDNGLLGDKLDNPPTGEQWSIYNVAPPVPGSALRSRHSVDNRQRTGSLTRQFSCSAVCNEMTFLLYDHIYGTIAGLPVLYIVIYYHLWKEIFSPLRICSRHPVIATLHNSWQNYGRKLAHNYAHSKVILNVYLADFFYTAFWLVFDFLLMKVSS